MQIVKQIIPTEPFLMSSITSFQLLTELAVREKTNPMRCNNSQALIHMYMDTFSVRCMSYSLEFKFSIDICLYYPVFTIRSCITMV